MAGKPRHDWYLKEWLRATQTPVSTLERETGWTHRIASELVNCRIRWNRDHLLLAASILRIHPFELLLDPDDAMHIRRLRAAVNEEDRLRVAEGRADYTAGEPEPTLAPRKAV